jgi:hypothetical protein
MLTCPIATRINAGIGLTVLWIAALAGLAYWKSDALCTLTLNEWGDFLAGAFAPLAFLWLVVGYMQQGEELQHSTNALRLQALELQNSVNQQRELVKVTLLQLESEREASAMVKRSQTEAAKPRFAIICNCQDLQRGSKFDIIVENTGWTVRHVTGYIEGKDFNKRQMFNQQIFETSKKLKLRNILSIKETETGPALEIKYVDIFDNHGSCRYFIRKEPHAYPVVELLDA